MHSNSLGAKGKGSSPNNDGFIHISELLNSGSINQSDTCQRAILQRIPTGFYDLDSKVQGLQGSELVIVAGRPSMGKTAFCLNIAHNIAAQRLPVAIFSLNMTREQLVQRLLASESKIESPRLSSGRVTEKEWHRISKATARVAKLPIFIDDGAEISIEEITSKVHRLQRQFKRDKLGVVLIDCLQSMLATDKPTKELSSIIRKLKVLAKELDIPVIAVSQVNRSVELRSDKRPYLNDLQISGSIEQAADLVLMLYREDQYDPHTIDKGLVEVSIAKHRNGPTGTVKLLFEDQYTQFRNLAGTPN